MKDKYSEYRLKIYADKGKLIPKNSASFNITESGRNTVCFELRGKENMNLRDIDQVTFPFENQYQFLEYFFHMTNMNNIPTVCIYKKRKNYIQDEEKEIKLEPLYRSPELALLLSSMGTDETMLNTRKKSFRLLKHTCYYPLYSSSDYIQYVMGDHTKIAISDHFLDIYKRYQNARNEQEEKVINKELKQYEKEMLKHYSKMRGFLVTYQNYQKDMQKDISLHSNDILKEKKKEKSWEQQVLDGEINLMEISKQARNEFYNVLNELQVLQEKLEELKKKDHSHYWMPQIMQLEKTIQDKFIELRWMYEQMECDAMVEDHEMIGFDEEMKEGAIYNPNSYGDLCRKTK